MKKYLPWLAIAAVVYWYFRSRSIDDQLRAKGYTQEQVDYLKRQAGL